MIWRRVEARTTHIHRLTLCRYTRLGREAEKDSEREWVGERKERDKRTEATALHKLYPRYVHIASAPEHNQWNSSNWQLSYVNFHWILTIHTDSDFHLRLFILRSFLLWSICCCRSFVSKQLSLSINSHKHHYAVWLNWNLTLEIHLAKFQIDGNNNELLLTVQFRSGCVHRLFTRIFRLLRRYSPHLADCFSFVQLRDNSKCAAFYWHYFSPSLKTLLNSFACLSAIPLLHNLFTYFFGLVFISSIG